MSEQAPKTSHLERTAAEPRGMKLHGVRLSHISQVNDRVRLFRLDLTSGPVGFLPGQWVDTFVPDTPKAGGFTITSAPGDASPTSTHTPHIELAVQKSPDNPPAAWLWRPPHEIIGSTLHLRIGGSFTFPPAVGGPLASTVKRLVLIAGGVGVNPFMSMLSHIGHSDVPGKPRVRLAYATKLPSEGEVVFLDRIAGLFREGRVRGSVDLFATGGGDGTFPDVVDVHRRRLSVADVERLVREDDDDHLASTLVYICGPPAMTDEFAYGLTTGNLRMDPSNVITEKWCSLAFAAEPLMLKPSCPAAAPPAAAPRILIPPSTILGMSSSLSWAVPSAVSSRSSLPERPDAALALDGNNSLDSFLCLSSRRERALTRLLLLDGASSSTASTSMSLSPRGDADLLLTLRRPLPPPPKSSLPLFSRAYGRRCWSGEYERSPSRRRSRERERERERDGRVGASSYMLASKRGGRLSESRRRRW
ncbi:Oxidoreductase NAD-binding domain [Geosmithia morbida]|uniref:Oxidoreductase NAD-binding domain n=1 Tax=Geosmithia morbida TaxID=1094350 RepID=A0A9P5D0M8_9HYPO|nr:Oxidoreductase NAD-binding domain [Geosmithia morbida]KAF4121787.1 Oxidoreductase NAD-binding domain [Geosmithia morbida]